MEERRLDGIDERESVDPVVSAIRLDQGRPFLQLGVTRGRVGLEREEGREGIDGRELERGRRCARLPASSGR